MRKKLIALALAGACVAPAAMAQTANPVTLYGRLFVSLESVEATGGATPLARRNRVSDQSSLFGIRGTEDLGGGLKAIFQLETGFKPDQNDTTFALRNSGVGLQGAFGTVILGRWDNPYKIIGYSIDPWVDNTIGGITAALHDKGNFDRRDQNQVQYWSPNWAGFAGRIGYSVNEGKTATASPTTLSASIVYSQGPLYAAFAYEKHNDMLGATVTPGAEEDGLNYSASYRVGPVKLAGMYEVIDKTGFKKQKAFLLAATFFAGNNEFIVHMQDSRDGGATNAALQPECDVWGVGYKYNFSKRTFFWGQYVKVDNNSAAFCNVATNRLPIANGQDPKGVAVGLHHVF